MENINRKCPHCEIEKLIKEFGKNKCSKDGINFVCKPCASERTKKWYRENLERKETTRKLWREINHKKMILQAARDRAKLKKVPFNLSEEDIIIPENCPILLIPLTREQGQASPSSISLDRIKPSLGYIKGNVQIISRLANAMKLNATHEQLILFADWINKNIKVENE